MEKFDDAGIGINLNDSNLVEVERYLRESASEIRDAIINEVQNRHFSLSVDVVSKNNRSILGIYISYIADGVLRIRNIGMKGLKDRHTGKYLFTIVENCLDQYGWNINRAITLTADNGSNMKTLLKSMNEKILNGDSNQNVPNETERSINQGENDVGYHSVMYGDIQNQTDFNEEIANLLHNMDADDEDEIRALMNDSLGEEEWELNNIEYADLSENIERQGSRIYFVNGVNCAAHTVQLAVKDALRQMDVTYSNIIQLSRAVVKFIRKESTRNKAEKRGLKFILPVIDIDTRWSSTYMMVNRIYTIYSSELATHN